MITTYMYLLCIYYAPVEKIGPTSRLKVNLTSNFILMIYQSAVIVSYENEAHNFKFAKSTGALRMAVFWALWLWLLPHILSNLVDVPYQSFLKDEGSIFGDMLANSVKRNEYIWLSSFSPGEISAVLFPLETCFSSREKWKESGWTDTGKWKGFTDIYFFFFSQQGIICSSKYFIFSSACLETWSRQGSDGFCQLQDRLLSCVMSEAECEHNMQVLAVIEVGCALAKEFKLVPYQFPESFQKNKRFKPLLHMTHCLILGALLLLASRFQSQRWGVRGLGVPLQRDQGNHGSAWLHEGMKKQLWGAYFFYACRSESPWIPMNSSTPNTILIF